MVEPKEIILAVLGASGSMAGLLLVFSRFMFSQASSFPSVTDDRILHRYTNVGQLAVYPFCGFLITTLLAIAWLLYPAPALYAVCITFFVVLVVGTGIYGALSSSWLE
jgi:hypothetical protein